MKTKGIYADMHSLRLSGQISS